MKHLKLSPYKKANFQNGMMVGAAAGAIQLTIETIKVAVKIAKALKDAKKGE